MILTDAYTDAGKGNNNDDRHGAAGGAAWVIDGATSLGPRRTKTVHASDAEWLADTMNRMLLALFADAGERSTQDVLADVVAQLQAQFLEDSGMSWEVCGDLPSASFALARSFGDRIELVNVGDCRIYHDGGNGGLDCTEFGTSAVSLLEAAAIAEFSRRQKESSAASFDQLLASLKPVLIENRKKANAPGGYWIVDLSGVWLAHLQQKTLREASRILIASDGFYRIVDTYRRHDIAGLLQAAQNVGGLAQIGGQIRDIERGDTSAVNYPRLKISDDSTAIMLTCAPD